MSDQPVLFSRAAASCRLTLNREDKCHAINEEMIESLGNDSNLLIVFYVQIMPDDFVMQLHRF